MSDHPLLPSRDHGFLTPFVYFSNNALSLAGVILVTASVVLWLFLIPASMRAEINNPYLGILIFLVLPAGFFLGLALIPLGIIIRYRRMRAAGKVPAELPPLNLRNPPLRRLLIFISATTVVNVLIGGQFTYRAVEYMDSVTFCGLTCHTLMTPEYTAYQNSPHARVACVECHIGSGASWYVRSKLSGARQVFATMFKTYPRPIPTPIENLRPARDTCEECHWPQKFGSARLRVIPSYASDENNTLSQTVLLMRIGGGGVPGIHGAHVGEGIRIRYRHSDRERQVIPWVELTRPDGSTTVFQSGDATPEQIQQMPMREMDCMDCHNRPSHTFSMPEPALDQAMASGEVPADLPWIKKYGLEQLNSTGYQTREEAMQAVAAKVVKAYQDNEPELYAQRRDEIERAGRGVAQIYGRNIFPEMNVTWGAYPNDLGHEQFPGCFRCHDEMHSDTAGKTIPQDCSTCHEMLAYGEENPEILKQLGISR